MNRLKKGDEKIINKLKSSIHYNEISDRIYFFQYILWSIASAKNTSKISKIYSKYSLIKADFLFVCEFLINSNNIIVKKYAHLYIRETEELGAYVPVSFYVSDGKPTFWPNASNERITLIELSQKN